MDFKILERTPYDDEIELLTLAELIYCRNQLFDAIAKCVLAKNYEAEVLKEWVKNLQKILSAIDRTQFWKGEHSQN